MLRQSRINLADDVQIAVVVQQLAGGDGVLTIENIVVTVPVADLRGIGDSLIKLGGDSLDTVGVEIPLVVAARNFQKLAVDDHFVMNKFNHRQILLPILRYNPLLSAKVQRLSDGFLGF